MKKKIALCLAVCFALTLLLCACQTQDDTQAQSVVAVTEQLEQSSDRYELFRVFASLFLFIFGVINLFTPRKMWEITKGRNRKPGSTEPTPAELNGERASGLILIVLGVFLFFGMIR